MGNICSLCCDFFGQWDHIVDPDDDYGEDDLANQNYDEDDLANQNYDEIKAKYIIPTD